MYIIDTKYCMCLLGTDDVSDCDSSNVVDSGGTNA